MPVYSFRAECEHDLAQLTKALRARGVISSMQVSRHDLFPDCKAELEGVVSLETLREVMRELPDNHVMIQTLRACPLADNSLERDRDIS